MARSKLARDGSRYLSHALDVKSNVMLLIWIFNLDEKMTLLLSPFPSKKPPVATAQKKPKETIPNK